MKVHVRRISDSRAEITVIPSWFERLFGHKPRSGIALNTTGGSWHWEATLRHVDSQFSGYPITSALELREIEALPIAKVKS